MQGMDCQQQAIMKMSTLQGLYVVWQAAGLPLQLLALLIQVKPPEMPSCSRYVWRFNCQALDN